MGIRPVAVALPWLMLAGALCATAVAQQPSMEDLRRGKTSGGRRWTAKELATFIHVTC